VGRGTGICGLGLRRVGRNRPGRGRPTGRRPVNPVRAGLPGGLVVDLVLLGLAALAARTGWRRGAVEPAFGLAGLLIALAVLLAVMIGRRAGRRVVQPVAAGLRAAGLGRLDAAGGAVLRAAVVLTGCWLLANLLTVLAPPVVAAPIGDSRVMGALDRALPTPVGRLAGASARLGLSALPAGLLGLIPAGARFPPTPSSPPRGGPGRPEQRTLEARRTTCARTPPCDPRVGFGLRANRLARRAERSLACLAGCSGC